MKAEKPWVNAVQVHIFTATLMRSNRRTWNPSAGLDPNLAPLTAQGAGLDAGLVLRG